MASGSKRVPAERSAPNGQPTESSTSAGTFRHLTKSRSGIMRELGARENMVSTEALVSAYNLCEVDEERAALYEWLSGYPNWFEDNAGKHILTDVLEEYTYLGNIKVRCPDDAALLKRVFVTLCKRAQQETYCEREVVLSLARLMQSIDERVFAGETTALSLLAIDLLKKLDPETNFFAKGNHETHSTTLFALNQALVLYHRIAPEDMIPNDEGGFFQKFDGTLTKILQCRLYYPTCFQVQMVQQGLRSLTEKTTCQGHQRLRRFLCGLSGCVYLYRAVRSVLLVDLDVESVEKAYSRLKTACSGDPSASCHWHECLSDLNEAALLSVQDPDKIDIFTQCSERLLAVQRELGEGQDSKSLRFGMVRQLRMLALEGGTTQMRRSASEELMLVATRCVQCEHWDKDVEVFEALLQALEEVHVKGENKDLTKPALVVMEYVANSNENLKIVLDKWLDGSTFDRKLVGEGTLLQEHDVPFRQLFDITRKQLGVVYTANDVTTMRESLRSYYLDDKFALIPRLFDEEERRHVSLFEFSIVHDKETAAKSSDVDEGSEDQISGNYARMQRIREEVNLDDVFEDRSLKSDTCPEKIRTVLIFGNPGCGKTTISKKIAYSWASGNWGKQFNALYVLPVRDLNKDAFGDSRIRKEVTLSFAAMSVFFSRAKHTEPDVVEQQIEDDFQRETTLLVLDGLDEANEIGRRMIECGIALPCSLLLLSRPYKIHVLRQDVQIMLECLGLSYSQLKRFVKSELTDASSGQLLRLLATNPGIDDLGRTPVIANILCFLSKEQEANRIEEVLDTSISNLYRRMADYVWRRFIKKYLLKADKDKAFLALSHIAHEAYMHGRIQISQDLVVKHCSIDIPEDYHKQVGFLLLKLEGNHYQFAHLTFQEFFAARRLAEQLSTEEMTREFDTAKKFVTAIRFSNQRETVLEFLMQEICASSGREGFDKLLRILESGMENVSDVLLSVLKLKLLDALISCGTSSIERIGRDQLACSIVEAVTSFVTCLRDDWDQLLDVIRQLEKLSAVVKHFPTLFRSLLDCLNSRSGRCRNATSDAVVRLARTSPAYATLVFDALSIWCNTGTPELRSRGLLLLRNLAPAMPHGKVEEVLELVDDGCRDEDRHVRIQAMSQLQHLMVAMPRLEQQIFCMAENLCQEDKDEVRELAYIPLCGIAKDIPTQASAILALSKRLCASEDDEIRFDAISRLHELAGGVPQLCAPIFELQKKLCRNDDEDVRLEAVYQLRQFAQKIPGLGDGILDLVEQGLRDDDELVRREVFLQLQDIADALPDHVDSVVVLLQKGCQSEEESIRSEALAQLLELTKGLPKRANKLIDLLTQGCQDEGSNVRLRTLSHLSNLMEALPQQRNELMKVLRKGSRDEDRDVRQMVLSQCLPIADTVPEQTDQVLTLALDGCSDEDRENRFMSFSLLTDFVRRIPGNRHEIIEGMMRIFYDADTSLRLKAIEKLETFAPFMTEQSSELLHVAIQGCHDSESEIQDASRNQLIRLCVVLPEQRTKILKTLASECKCTDGSGTAYLMSELLRYAKKLPHRRAQTLETVKQMCLHALSTDRSDAFSLLPNIVKELPDQNCKLVEMMRSLCSNDNVDIRTRAYSQLAGIGRKMIYQNRQVDSTMLSTFLHREGYEQSGSEQGSLPLDRELHDREIEIIELAKNGCLDVNPNVRMTASKQLSALTAELPDKRDAVVELMEECCSSRSQDVFDHLSTLAKMLPNRCDAILKLLETGYAHAQGSIGVRSTALAQLPALARQWPDNGEDILRVVKLSCTHEDLGVRRTAFWQLFALAEQWPDERDVVLRLLEECCDDGARCFRRSSLTQLRSPRKLWPDNGDVALRLLEEGYNDGARGIRLATFGKLVVLKELWPGEARAIVGLLKKACVHEHWEVRMAAFGQLGSLAELSKEDEKHTVLELLQKGCKDPHSEVRRAAFGQLGALANLWKGNEKHIMLELLQEGCKDPHSEVREAAFETLVAIEARQPDKSHGILEVMAKRREDENQSSLGLHPESRDAERLKNRRKFRLSLFGRRG